jgi:hypothetical protein
VRLPGILSALRRVLNVEGFDVISGGRGVGHGVVRPGAIVPAVRDRGNELEADDFDFQALFHFVFTLEELVDGIERPGVVVALSTFSANLGFDVFDDVEFAVKPVVFAHLLRDRFATTELASHSSSFVTA